ncbi:unnamed protein product [Ectocarpus sp. CCAP 1310/34]|nr:unnamed protein product [Ectocarpus sp. CCAP 1310/34]
MKEISMRPLQPFFKFVYQTPSRTSVGPFAASSRLWHAMNDLREPPPPSPQASSPVHQVEGDVQEEEGSQGEVGGVHGSQEEEGVERGGGAADRKAGGRKRERLVDGGIFDGLGGGLGLGLMGGGYTDDEEEEEGEGGSNGFFSKEVDADSDPIAAVVYSVTPPTNAERQGWEHAHNEVGGRLPIGQRRVCLVMSRRSAESHLKILKMGGAKDKRSWADVKGKISSEGVPGVGDVETVDVPLTKANMKLFRVLLEERAGCAYAVTDAPMVQLEMSGERQVTGGRVIGLRFVNGWRAP